MVQKSSRNFTRFNAVKLLLTNTSVKLKLPLVEAKLRPKNLYKVPSICMVKIRPLTNTDNGYQIPDT